LPLPNQPYDPAALTGNYIGNGSQSGNDNIATVKGDILLSGNSSLALTYSRGRPFATNPRVSPVNPITWDGMQERGTANFITGGAAWTSETRFGYNYNHLSRNDGYWTAALNPALPETIFGGARMPSFEIPCYSPFNPTYGAGSKFINFGGPAWSLEETYARHFGPHSFKFGGIYAFHGAGRANISAPDVTYANLSDLLANVPSSIAFSFGSNQFHTHNWELGFFLQDEWRLSSKLVINLGLRYDYFSDIVVQPDNPSAPAGLWNWNGLLNPYTFNFGPLRSNAAEPINSDGCGSNNH
jgi:outer membrane receptor protein involved in Fe transport